MTIRRDFEVHKFFVYGIMGAISLTIFLFGLAWTEIGIIGEDVSVVREDVAYIKGQLDTYWPEISNEP